jgi:glycosyltransferase involved in cell wall biosynthesis/2-polyprenyl-3-methyl-5-hydroxy-6-metoxy-1,4-benzoquinol methylase/uncharacterized coiled-coil protein SlyX
MKRQAKAPRLPHERGSEGRSAAAEIASGEESAPNHVSRCWCGNETLEGFSDDYFRCAHCETLVAARMPDPKNLLAGQDEQGFYGHSYFESYQVEKLGFPPIAERARRDLPERCVHWLRALLKFKLPPARILELGSAHGGFVALMRWAGYQATGLELSPWVVDFARQTFGVPMLQGPIEAQSTQPLSLDAVVLMDVLEHLPDPVKTLQQCVRLLKPDGILLIQTPSYRESMSLEQMVAAGDEFVKMLLPDQHLYLFSKRSVAELLRRVGAEHVQFESAIFPAYDMFLVGTKAPASVIPEEEIQAALTGSRDGRLVRALLDLRSSFEDLTVKHVESEADRADRLQAISAQGYRLALLDEAIRGLSGQLEAQQARLAESDADRIARRADIESLQLLLAESDADRIARHADIESLQQLLAESDADRMARRVDIESLQQLLAESDADRIARRADIEALQRLLAESEADRANRLKAVEALDALRGELEAGLASAEARATDLKAEASQLEGLVAEREKRVSELNADLASKQRALEGVQRDLRFVREALERLQASYVYRLLRRFGLWEWLSRAIARVAHGERARAHQLKVKPLERVVVDLTPVLSGGENGGAKVMTIELLRQLSRLARSCEFILLTSETSHDELAFLDSPNMRRLCIQRGSVGQSPPAFLLRMHQRLSKILPPAILRRLKRVYRAAGPVSGSLLRQLNADVLFCPFTAPFFVDPRVPTVSVIYDLQHVYYPHFFPASDRDQRGRSFHEACSAASKLVCISDYVRQTVLENAALSPDRVETIHISLPNRVAQPSPADREKILDRYKLEDSAFLLYPANFWPHKNHEMLLTAFGMYRARHPESRLKLVLTGAPGKRMEYIREAARRMALDQCVVLGGYLPDSEFAALLWSSLALIFPSLYEGFGMPVLEAMAAGKPVLCSNVTSLPEIAGDAAILFDPKKPGEIASAIARVTDDPEYARELANRGCQRVGLFGGPREMASRYLRVFQDVAGRPALSASRIHGVYSDGWAAGHLIVTFGEGPVARKLMVELTAPDWAPASPSKVRLLPVVNGTGEVYSISRGETVTLERVLPEGSGFVEIEVQPEFQPAACGVGQDTRWIGCRFGSAQILSGDGTLTSLESDPYGA